MNKVFRKIGNPEITLPYETLSVDVDKQITIKVKQPLWDAEGKRLGIDELTAIGYEVFVTPDQTPEYLEFMEYRALFTANPDLEARVIEYKAFFDELEIPYNSNTDVMEAAIKAKIDEDKQVEYVQRMQTALTNVKVNYQAAIAAVHYATGEDTGLTGNDFETWLHTPLLIKYMPSAGLPQPEYKEPYVATKETEAAEEAAKDSEELPPPEIVPEEQAEEPEE